MASANAVSCLIILNVIVLCVSVSANHVHPCPPKAPAKCPRDTLKFGACGDWLGLVHEVVGTQPSQKCCHLVKGLADLEAAVCLCTAIKANVVGIVTVEIPVALNLVINGCGKKVPPGFVCS